MEVEVIQLTSSLFPEVNLKKIAKMIGDKKENKKRYIYLPEVFYSISNGKEKTPYLVSENNEHFKQISNLAKEKNVYLLGGSVAYDDNGIIRNRVLNFNSHGELISSYDKINLFKCDLSNHPSKKVLDESKVYTKGNSPLVSQIDGVKIGFSVCFDLRFPEMYREYRKAGAKILSISAAFTVPTGKAHFETLLRARAIENQCFVIASAQWGKHNDEIETYGHSMIIDPWGEIIANANEGESKISAILDFKRLDDVRSRMNVLPT